MMRHATLFLVLLATVSVVGCGTSNAVDTKGGGGAVPTSNTAPSSAASSIPQTPAHTPDLTPEPRGDAARGKALVIGQECVRCHDGLDGPADHQVKAIANTSHCVKCHQDVMAGKYDHKADAETWKKNVGHLVAVPSLDAAGRRLSYRWIVDYLMSPHDVRPNLVYNMPRLSLTREEARDIGTYLVGVPTDGTEADGPAMDLAGADLNEGKKLLAQKGCGSCHTMTGTDAFAKPVTVAKVDPRVAVMLAPDLSHASKRLRPEVIRAWLSDPAKVKPGTLMPQTPLTDAEMTNIVGYLMHGERTAKIVAAQPAAPKPLERKVTFDEVNERVFAKICRHCHGNPDEGVGDGGPGNTGGFGFPARGLELTSYKRVLAGYRDDAGERQSIFARSASGVPRIVQSLLARYGELAGTPDPDVRGMPMGLPPLEMTDIQLLVTWIAQGRKR